MPSVAIPAVDVACELATQATRGNCNVLRACVGKLPEKTGHATDCRIGVPTSGGSPVISAARVRVAQSVSWSLLLLLCACAASGPTFDEAGFSSKSIPDGKARVVFFRTRESALYLARRAAVSMDGEKIGGIGYGSFLFHDIDAGNHGLRADMWDMPGQCELIFTAATGETYYFQIDPRSESFGAFAAGDLATQVLTMNVFVNVAGGVSAVAAESYGKECGGAFRIYPVDAGTAITRLGPLRHAG